ncbi:hypothetical protein TNCV_304851 [Trichonephila clavipes]|nr:hypothetical protein TNCV_304851 [Trichonephila clavipes]
MSNGIILYSHLKFQDRRLESDETVCSNNHPQRQKRLGSEAEEAGVPKGTEFIRKGFRASLIGPVMTNCSEKFTYLKAIGYQLTRMRLQMVWNMRAAVKILHMVTAFTFSEIATRVKQDISSSWRQAPIHERYEGNRPGAVLLGTGSR